MLDGLKKRILKTQDVKDDKNATKKRIFLCVAILSGLALYVWMFLEHRNQYLCNAGWLFVCLTAVYALIIFLIGWRINHTYIHEVKSWWGVAIYFFIMPSWIVLIEEITWNPDFTELNIKYFFVNYLLILLVEIGLYLIVNRPFAVYMGLLLFFWIYGLVNHYILEFKGCPILPKDLLAIQTATNVMGLYKYHLSDSIIIGAILLLFVILALIYFPPSSIPCRDKKERVVLLAAGVLWLGIAGSAVYQMDLQEMAGMDMKEWRQKENFTVYGAPATFFCAIQNLKQEPPEGYSEEAAGEILNQYEKELPQSAQQQPKEQPSVIVIMNESFSDLSVLGDFESDDYLSNFKNMNQYIMKGYTYVSVAGGGTCNSEFEFLTGNSMANFSGDSYAYPTFGMEHTFSLAEAFKSSGYETLAFHPYYANGWNRDKVYAQLGFDEFISLENLEDVEYLRWCASDAYDFKQVIRMYEERTAPLFLFNVTMQNHGFYDINTLNGVSPVSIENKYSDYSEVITYLTCMRESDAAFAELIKYFSGQKEPVIVCMFGDHQPAVEDDFYERLMGGKSDELDEAEKLYMTPYVVWSNFDMETKQEEVDMSANYLGANILKLVGIHTPYTDFLLDMQQSVPVINIAGYQTSDGKWHEGKEENDIISKYWVLQYYQMFGDR